MDTPNLEVEEKFRILGNDGKTIPKTMDARAWAIAFVYSVRQNTNIPTDEGCMIGWFANAIMAGYDAGSARAIKEVSAIVDALTEKLAKSPPTFADYRKYECQICKGEATVHVGPDLYFCPTCLEKIDGKPRERLG